uniref:dTMP kinase n=1 Tax=Clastoptera arizonana TaxID=38151 RepID=A0A1B6EDY3_9HEMI
MGTGVRYKPKMTRLLNEGTTIVVDRYAFSGVAFSAAKSGMNYDWCKAPDEGLLKPDIVFLLSLCNKSARERAGFGEERYENSFFQSKVAPVFQRLKDSTWKEINAEDSIEDLHALLFKDTIEIVKKCKTSPLRYLWE